MSEPFLAEIKMFGGDYAPRDWAFCDGAIVEIGQNPALFSLLGTTYGGDGRVNFGLPNLQGRAPMHPGSGPGLSYHRLGETGGHETVQLNTDQIPNHDHAPLQASEATADSKTVGETMFLGTLARGRAYHAPTNPVSMSESALASTGGGQAHNNMQPFTYINFIIAMEGIFPSRP
ncbi:MAG: phage tail protein [bacterium]|nr:phage tail protein [bacterium]